MDNKTKALIYTKALALTENGGKIGEPKAGKTGEMKSIFQYTPNTWKAYSKEITGKELPLTKENEVLVTHQKVQKWVDEGKTGEQIASMWNAGPGKPNAYKENWKGVNKKYGVAYDTPAYAKKFMAYATKVEQEGNIPTDTDQPQTPQNEDLRQKAISALTKLKDIALQRQQQGQQVQS